MVTSASRARAASSSALVSVSVGAASRRTKTTRSRDDAQKKEIQSVVKIVDDAGRRTAGAERPRRSRGSREDLLKARATSSTCRSPSRSIRRRSPAATSRSTGASCRRTRRRAAAAADRRQEGRQERTTRQQEARVRLRGHQLRAGQPGQTTRCASAGRSPCPPATTTSIVVAKEPTPEKAPKNAPPPKVVGDQADRRPCPISGTTS